MVLISFPVIVIDEVLKLVSRTIVMPIKKRLKDKDVLNGVAANEASHSKTILNDLFLFTNYT